VLWLARSFLEDDDDNDDDEVEEELELVDELEELEPELCDKAEEAETEGEEDEEAITLLITKPSGNLCKMIAIATRVPTTAEASMPAAMSSPSTNECTPRPTNAIIEKASETVPVSLAEWLLWVVCVYVSVSVSVSTSSLLS
jgi:hypothetical protein